MDQSLQLLIFHFQQDDLAVEIYFDGKEEDHHLFLQEFQIMETNMEDTFWYNHTNA